MSTPTYGRTRIRWGRVIAALFILAAIGLGVWDFLGKPDFGLDFLKNKKSADTERTEKSASDEATTATDDEACLAQPAKRRDVLAEIRRRGLRIVVERDAPPFNNQVNGQSTGFDYEVARAVAKRLGIPKVEMVYASGEDYGVFPCYLHDGRADWFMGGYVPTAKFDKLVSWSDSYYPENGYCLVVKNGSGIRSVRDLAGKRVAVYDEDAAADWVRDEARAEAVRYTDAGPVDGPTFPQNQQDQGRWMEYALYNGGLDAAVYDYPFAVAELNNSPGKLKIVQYNLGSLPYAIGLPSNNPDLLEAVNGALSNLLEAPEYADLVRRFIPTPGKFDAAPAPAAGLRKHTVKTGETLSRIAATELGDVKRWPQLWEWNKSRIPNPHLIEPGDVLVLEGK